MATKRTDTLHREPQEKTKENKYKLHWEKFLLNIRKTFFTVKTINHCNNCPRDVVECPSLEVFKMPLCCNGF